MNIFKTTNILVPKIKDMEKWSVIACDQFTSQMDYWDNVREYVGENPSTLNMILPEAELQSLSEERLNTINKKMEEYIREEMFNEYKESMIYVERTLMDGSIRKGVVGVIDLEEYDYHAEVGVAVRATEQTVLERIPPRREIRRNASLECSHVLLLCNDEEKNLIEPLEKLKRDMALLYDFDLMAKGGHISGWLMQGEILKEFEKKIEAYERKCKTEFQVKSSSPLIYAVGDGNHSLATAKACYEETKKENNEAEGQERLTRYAMVELGNIHDNTLHIEAIHRLISDTNPEKLLKIMEEEIGDSQGILIEWYSKDKKGEIRIKNDSEELVVGIIQEFLDRYIENNKGYIDYIHGEDNLKNLSSFPGNIGFLLPTIEKKQLFRSIVVNGVLPRKTFSMGHAEEKRYYLEVRKIK